MDATLTIRPVGGYYCGGVVEDCRGDYRSVSN